jgi:hypothetical protein
MTPSCKRPIISRITIEEQKRECEGKYIQNLLNASNRYLLLKMVRTLVTIIVLLNFQCHKNAFKSSTLLNNVLKMFNYQSLIAISFIDSTS